MKKLQKPKKAYPTWIPVARKPWRLVAPFEGSRDGFVRGSDGTSLRFESAAEALEYLESHNIEFWKPWEDDH